MSVFELIPHSALHAGETNPYNPVRLSDDHDPKAGVFTSPITPTLDPGNRRLFIRRDQVSTIQENGQKIKPKVQFKRRHGALASQDSSSF